MSHKKDAWLIWVKANIDNTMHNKVHNLSPCLEKAQVNNLIDNEIWYMSGLLYHR